LDPRKHGFEFVETSFIVLRFTACLTPSCPLRRFSPHFSDPNVI